MTATIESEQLVLPFGQFTRPEPRTGFTIQEAFERFHALNPWVLNSLEVLTEDYLKQGAERVGIGMLFEVLRWQYHRKTISSDFRLNNNYRSRYVRLLIERRPEWATVFETRELRS